MAEEPKTQKRRITLRPKKLKGVLDRVTQEMYRRNFELAETNKTLSLLRTIDTLVLQSQYELPELCRRISESLAVANDYPFVGIMAHNNSYNTDLELYGWAGTLSPTITEHIDILKKLRVDTQGKWLKHDEARDIYVNLTQLSLHTIADVVQMNANDVKALKTAVPLTSFYAVKLVARNHLIGLLVVGFTYASPEDMLVTDRSFLERVSEPIGVALDSKLLVEENKRVLKKLQKTNNKLKMLDENKDEFISMASHQLRTPLTSVKGYVSMVIEGDAGELNEMQKKLLGQAFASSQRMVFLIADLLNLSRLKTGKFVIETMPTDLAEVIESEVGQLIESAKGRNLTLTYDKPANFPKLMLDETKIRQVIMNFTDNAIYYTPSGGHIKLDLVDRPDSVEFSVKDDGIGVPKAEQHKLFAKFYRAGNAQKARPDGTGLGLFMAQKVIVAQGGAIIFKSVEGKGSTFGFSFPKKGHLPPKISPAVTS
jgi:signal transduction histidine kinase